jgi:probable phosphoglycerate mutase
LRTHTIARQESENRDVRLIIIRHGETDWTRSGQHTGVTDLALTENGRRQAASLGSLVDDLLGGERPVVYSSPRKRAIETADLALPDRQFALEPLVAEYDYGDYEGLTGRQIALRAPGWDIWRDGCPGGESTDDVGTRADTFLGERVENATGPVIVVSHGHFSRILAARALRLPAESGSLFASATGSVSMIEEYHGRPCIGVWNLCADQAGRRRG